MAGRVVGSWCLLLALTGMSASPALAQALRDPTRPPFFSSARGPAGPATPSVWNLQSVLISPERRYAIINGEIVPLGGSIGGAELVAITEERVTLRTADGLRVVRLFPNVRRLEAATGARTAEGAADVHNEADINKRANPGVKQ